MNKIHSSVSIVVLNWNGVYLLKKYLPSVIAASAGAEVIIVDDGSTDASCEFIRYNFPSVRLVVKPIHEGFASSANVGVNAATRDIVVLLNTDVKPRRDFLRFITPHFRDPQIFAVGCLDKSYEDGIFVARGRGEAIWRRGFYIHWKGDIHSGNTAWVSGGSGAFRKSMWQKLGGMDTIFNPFYWEDIDLSYRALKAGYRLVFEPKSIVEHYHEEGKIQLNYTPSSIQRIAYRNQFIFIWKNLSNLQLLTVHFYMTPFYLIKALVRGDINMIVGYIMAIRMLPIVLTSRRRNRRQWSQRDHQLPIH